MSKRGPSYLDAKERFLNNIEYDTNGGCWLWSGTVTGHKRGTHLYGTLGVKEENKWRHHLAHRFSYEKFNGSIPKNFHVLHKCDVTYCVNPKHLFVGTAKDNVEDMVDKNRDCCPATLIDIKYIFDKFSEGWTRERLAKATGYGLKTIKTLRRRWRLQQQGIVDAE